jgi:cysteine desulfurase
MTVNNETGVIQPIKEIGALLRKHRGVYFHTDAAQAVGKIPLDVNEMNIDLLSISGHKLYGPKGIGAAYVRRRPRVRLEPLLSGGGQERGLRSGTLPPALIVGLGEAARIAKNEIKVYIAILYCGRGGRPDIPFLCREITFESRTCQIVSYRGLPPKSRILYGTVM